MSAFYWERHPDGPFATLIAVATTYCGPDAYDGAYQDLVRRARAADADDDEMRVFKAELRPTGVTRGFCGGCGATCMGTSRSGAPEAGGRDRPERHGCGTVMARAISGWHS